MSVSLPFVQDHARKCKQEAARLSQIADDYAWDGIGPYAGELQLRAQRWARKADSWLRVANSLRTSLPEG